MAVKLITTIQRFIGLSSDSKPSSPPVGSTFFEDDTQKKFKYNGSAWVIQASQPMTYRETRAANGHTWMENFLIDVGTDLADDIGTTYVTLSKLMFILLQEVTL